LRLDDKNVRYLVNGPDDITALRSMAAALPVEIESSEESLEGTVQACKSLVLSLSSPKQCDFAVDLDLYHRLPNRDWVDSRTYRANVLRAVLKPTGCHLDFGRNFSVAYVHFDYDCKDITAKIDFWRGPC
jgi:hypothetical protein